MYVSFSWLKKRMRSVTWYGCYVTYVPASCLWHFNTMMLFNVFIIKIFYIFWSLCYRIAPKRSIFVYKSLDLSFFSPFCGYVCINVLSRGHGQNRDVAEIWSEVYMWRICIALPFKEQPILYYICTVVYMNTCACVFLSRLLRVISLVNILTNELLFCLNVDGEMLVYRLHTAMRPRFMPVKPWPLSKPKSALL